jgi:hypothetical protein
LPAPTADARAGPPQEVPQNPRRRGRRARTREPACPGTFDFGSLVAALAAYERLNEPWQELLDYYQQREIAKVRYEQIVATCEAPSSPPGSSP